MTWRACLALIAGTVGSAHAGYAAVSRAYPVGYWIGTACLVAAFGLVVAMVCRKRSKE